ncbi:MAG TPA: hypothetical protein VLA51_02600, partial [Paracoccaceae bacterium]|nr:hypothetical protein [Paracoccaceae bacterium]
APHVYYCDPLTFRGTVFDANPPAFNVGDNSWRRSRTMAILGSAVRPWVRSPEPVIEWHLDRFDPPSFMRGILTAASIFIQERSCFSIPEGDGVYPRLVWSRGASTAKLVSLLHHVTAGKPTVTRADRQDLMPIAEPLTVGFACLMHYCFTHGDFLVQRGVPRDTRVRFLSTQSVPEPDSTEWFTETLAEYVRRLLPTIHSILLSSALDDDYRGFVSYCWRDED